MSERTDSTFDVEGEAGWDIADKCEAVREQWAADAIQTAREDTDYGELFRRALVVKERLRNYALEIASIAEEAAMLRYREVEANKELVPDELADCYRADFVGETGEDCNTVFPEDTAGDLSGLAEDLAEILTTEAFDRLKYLADLWEAHWARHHDVNHPVTDKGDSK